jgi:predicted PurR-regulated permease PerM
LVKKKGLAAFFALLFTLIVVCLPIGVFGFFVFQEAQELYTRLSIGSIQSIEGITSPIESFIEGKFPGFDINLEPYARQATVWITEHIGSFFAGTAQAVIGFMLWLIAYFYFLRDGEKFVNLIIEYSPLSKDNTRTILIRLKQTISSVVRGSILIAIIQGILTGIGFALFGIPSAGLWGSVAIISALIPGIGTALVLAPGIIFLFATGSTIGGLGLLAWGIVAVGLIDNVLGPSLMGRGVNIHPLFILLSVLGGIVLVGPIGLLVGPVIISAVMTLASMHPKLVEEKF